MTDKPLLMTCDGLSFLGGWKDQYEYPITPEAVLAEVKALAGSHVGIFQWCIGSTTAFFDSRVLEIWGSSEHQHKRFSNWQLAKNLRHLIESGNDPLRIVCEEGHSGGMQVWGSRRMNDRHHTYKHIDPPQSDYYRENPELRLPDGSYNWARSEVRELSLAFMRDVAERYDVDGIDLDYTRSPGFFAPDDVDEGRPLMTEFVRDMRSMLDEVGEKKGNRLGLSAQVYAHDPERRSVQDAYGYGLDLRQWASEGLIDILIGHYRSKACFEPDITEWKEVVEGTNCRLYAGPGKPIRRYVSAPGNARWHTLEEHRAIAAHLYDQGADGVSFYDYMMREEQGFDVRHLVKDLGGPDEIRFKDKVYVAQVDLPLELGNSATGGEAKTELRFSDDLEVAARYGCHPRIRLLLNIQNVPNLEDVAVFLNGESLGSPVRESVPRMPFRGFEHPEDCPWWHLELAVDPGRMRRGMNELRFVLSPRYPNLHASVQVMKIDLEVTYGSTVLSYPGYVS